MTCVAALSCGDPGSVAGGQVQCAEGHLFSKSCVLQCNSGFNQTGATAVMCESNGQWSTQLGQCVGEYRNCYLGQQLVFCI